MFEMVSYEEKYVRNISTLLEYYIKPARPYMEEWLQPEDGKLGAVSIQQRSEAIQNARMYRLFKQFQKALCEMVTLHKEKSALMSAAKERADSGNAVILVVLSVYEEYMKKANVNQVAIFLNRYT